MSPSPHSPLPTPHSPLPTPHLPTPKFMTWNFSSPTDSPLSDREVPLESHHLWGKRIALLVTGGIAAMKAPLIA
ncbi:MAG: phosphopantothenoylcysteine decarboxylase, partial [Microcystis aeruginosa]